MLIKCLYMSIKNNVCKCSFKERRNEGMIPARNVCQFWLYRLIHGVSVRIRSLNQGLDICLNICNHSTKFLTGYMVRLHIFINNMLISIILLHTCMATMIATMYQLIGSILILNASIDIIYSLKACFKRQNVCLLANKYVTI